MNHDPKINDEKPTSDTPFPESTLFGERRFNFRSDSPFPDADSRSGGVGDFGIAITLRSLGNTLPSERALVADCLIEIAHSIKDTIPANAGNQP